MVESQERVFHVRFRLFHEKKIYILCVLRMLISAFIRVGGYNEMVARYPDSMSNFTRYSNTTCGRPKDDYMDLFRDPETGDLPWPGILGVTINSIWYWCADQV